MKINFLNLQLKNMYMMWAFDTIMEAILFSTTKSCLN